MSESKSAEKAAAARPWTGPTRRYDIVKEGFIAIVVMSVLAVALAGLFSSPDIPALTFKGWADNAGENLYATTVSELAGTSESAGYGSPYNDASEGLSAGPLTPQKWVGVKLPVDTAQDFVITPLESQQQPPAVDAAVNAWKAASPDQQAEWATAFDDAVQATVDDAGDLHLDQVEPGQYGPVPVLAQGLLNMGKSGALDGAMLSQGGFYPTNQTKQILFLGDGSYLDDAATEQHLQGNTWGMMNGVNNYPGQPWLWWSSVWYQLPVFNAAEDAVTTTALQDNADLWIFLIIGAVGLISILLPFIPGLRSIPRWIPVYRVVWRNYYARHGNTGLK